MSRSGCWVLSVLMWTWGGAAYFLLEVAYKTARGEPERISWTMLVLAAILCIPIERAGAEMPWDVPLWMQAAGCAVLVTATELIAGLILNVWLGLGVWDYSDLWGNLWGQICPQFAAIWWGLCLVFIPVFDWMRYAVAGGERPRYRVI
ncbi:MAG: putative ABC transporter permease [Dysosmobacter sp.]